MADSTISAETPDWRRERCQKFWDPGRRLMSSIRRYQKYRAVGNRAVLLRMVCVLEHHFWSAISGADIPLNTKIAGGLAIPHPNGIVIHPDVEIGPNCIIFQQVTLGYGNNKTPGVPKIGGDVEIGAGAKIFGGISIGNHTKIGANAVVLINVPDGVTAVGVPARLLSSA